MSKALSLLLILFIFGSCGVKVELTSSVPSSSVATVDNRDPFIQLASQRVASIPTIPQKLADSISDRRFSVSSDGRYMVFSSSDAFSPGVKGTRVYLYDRVSEVMTLISRTSSPEVFENGQSLNPKISRDGSVVIFTSLSTNLDATGASSGNLYTYEVSSGDLVRLDIEVAGVPDLSDDGQEIAFLSSSPTLVASDNNGVTDVFVLDQLTQLVKRVSVSNSGQEADQESTEVSISGDGLIVSFTTTATNLIDGIALSKPGPFLYYTLSETVEMVGVKRNRPDAELYGESLNYDGTKLLFVSGATNLGPADSLGPDLYIEDRSTKQKELVVANSQMGGISGNGRYVAYISSTTGDIYKLDRDTQATELVSCDENGNASNNNNYSGGAVLSISNDGRYVAFISDATNLVGTDVNGVADVFVKDTVAGTVHLASSRPSGAQANAASGEARISLNGRYVVFTSSDSNLVGDDNNLQTDVFRKDLETGIISIVSRDTNGLLGNGLSDSPSISEDGRYVVFRSGATNLIPNDTNSVADVFLKDMDTGTLSLVSSNSAGGLSNDSSQNPSISADGRSIVFLSRASNLISDPTNGDDQIFLKDTTTGVTTLISRSNRGDVGNNFSKPATISPNGQFVTFVSYSTNFLDTDETDGRLDLYIKDLSTDRFSDIKTSEYGEQSAISENPKLARDGSSLFFESYSDRFVSADTNGKNDIFKYNLTSQIVTRVSLDAGDNQAGDDVSLGSVSDDGSLIQLVTAADLLNLSLGNFNLYLRDEANAQTTLVSVDNSVPVNFANKNLATLLSGGVSLFAADEGTGFALFEGVSGTMESQSLPLYDGDDGQLQAAASKVSSNGRYVVFATGSSNMVAGDTNEQEDVFIRDTFTGEIRLVSTSSAGAQGNGTSAQPSVSADGRYVVFSSFSSNLVAGDANGTADIFMKDLSTGELTLVSSDLTSVAADAASLEPDISDDGLTVVFHSNATDLVSGDSNNQRDIFIWSALNRQTSRVSVSGVGAQGNNESSSPSLSGDGVYVVFDSRATNLVTTNTGGIWNVFRKNLLTGVVDLVSLSGSTLGNSRSYSAELSGDGRYVLFVSDASNFFGGDTNGASDIFIKDMELGTLKLVSGREGALVFNAYSANPSVSDDGRYVVFNSPATNVLTSTSYSKVFLKDLVEDEYVLMDSSMAGIDGNSSANGASLSADGKVVSFSSSASNLIPSKKIYQATDQVFVKKWKK